MTLSDQMRKKWEEDWDKLGAEIDFAMATFIKNAKCKCKIYDGLYGNSGELLVTPYKICRHWKKERNRVFGERINELFDRVLKTGFQTMKDFGVKGFR